MSFQEKSNLAMAAIVSFVYGGYFVTVLGWASNDPVSEIAWKPLFVGTVISLIVLAIAAHVVIAVIRPDDAGAFDERDRIVDLRGEAISGYALGTAVMVALGLILFDVDVFWVAQTLLAGAVLGELIKYATTFFLYRTGV